MTGETKSTKSKGMDHAPQAQSFDDDVAFNIVLTKMLRKHSRPDVSLNSSNVASLSDGICPESKPS
jgi:hypothetical protein